MKVVIIRSISEAGQLKIFSNVKKAHEYLKTRNLISISYSALANSLSKPNRTHALLGTGLQVEQFTVE